MSWKSQTFNSGSLAACQIEDKHVGVAETTRLMHLQAWVQFPALFTTSQVIQGRSFICSKPISSSIKRKGGDTYPIQFMYE